MSSQPLVSMILTTRDRPGFLETALRCFDQQRYPNRELIIVDDGELFPVSEELTRASGATLIRTPVDTPLGEKLNHGIDAARGELIQKMDDDDWYAPDFVENTTARLFRAWNAACRPTIIFTAPFLFFNLAAWEIRQSTDNNLPGATICFPRTMWVERPFRHVPSAEDLWFYRDHTRLGAVAIPVRGVEHFIAVRHQGSARDRSHTWEKQWNNQPLEQYLESRPLVEGGPERLLPDWALAFYRTLHHEILERDAAMTGADES